MTYEEWSESQRTKVREAHRGLWHSARKVAVEDVTPRMKKPCAACESTPAKRRLSVVSGSGRAQTSLVFCSECGPKWVRERIDEASRTIQRLTTDEDVCVRSSR